MQPERRLPAWTICRAIPEPSTSRSRSGSGRLVVPPLACPAMVGSMASRWSTVIGLDPGMEAPLEWDMTTNPAALAQPTSGTASKGSPKAPKPTFM